MTKRLMAKVDEYQKDGKTKGKYVEIGVILSNDDGEYALINPTVNLAGVLMKQRILNPKKGGNSVICSIFDNSWDSNAEQGNVISQKAATDFDDDIPF